MVSIVADFRERGLDDLTSDVDQLVRKFRDLKKTADTLGTDNLTKVLLAQAKASQQAARATAEQARAEQQRQRTQQVSLKTAQQTAKAELAKAKAQTESARTTREIARAEQEQSKVSQQRLKTQQQALKVETELSRAQQQAAKVLVEQARATREAAKAAQTAARAREVEGTATKTAAQRLKEYTDANLRLAKAANLPLSSVKQLTRELGVTPQRAEQLVRRFNELQSSGSRAANTFKVLSRETGISARQFLALQKSIGVSTRDLQNLSTIGAATGLALARIFSGAGSTFVDFQRNIQGAAVRAGETLESFEGVREEAARLGATTSLTAGDISQTVDQLSRMGFTSDQTEASLSGLVQGAEGAGEALTTVTNVAGRAINQFGLTASSAGNVTDILVTAANAADVSVSTLGESLKFAGTVANSANQSLEDTTFLLALAGNAGLRGGQAGRNFVSFLQRLDIASAASNSQLAGLARGSQRAADALAVLGSKVRDETTGELKSMRELLPILRDDLVNLRETSPGDFGIVTKALFGTQGRRFADAIIGATDEDLAQLEERFGSLEGASARSSKALQEGLPGALRQLQSASEGLELRAFQEFAGLSEILVRSLTGVIRGFQELDPRIQSFLIQTTSIGALLVTAVGALSAFNLALRTLQPIQSAQAAVTQLQNIRLAAQAAVSATATAAQNAYAIATGKATAVQKQQVAAFAAQAARAGLFAGAIAAVSLAVGQYNEIQASTADTARAVEVVDEAYQKLIETQARAAEGAESAARAEESVARNAAAITDNLGPISTTLDTILRGPLNGIVEQVDNVLQKAIDFLPIPDQIKDALLGLVPGFTAIETVAGNFATAGETATNRQIIKFGELIKSTQDVEGAYFDVIQTLEQGGDVDPAALNDLQAAINASIISLEEARPITTEDLKLRDAQIRRFQTAKERLDEYTSATDDAAAATDDLGDSITSSIEGLSEGLEAELALVERDQARAAAELAEQAGLSEAERQERALSAQQDGQSQRLAAAKQYYENIEQLAAEDPGNLELQDELINAETAYYQAREELAKTSAEERQSVEDAALEQTKSAIADAEAAAEAAATSRAR
ncbi:MAG: phage tail tape measure protein [Cyanobacteria bacterium J06607_13]